MAPGPAPKVLKIARKVREELMWLVRQHQMPHVLVQRARILLLAHEGIGTTASAALVGCAPRTVRKWKARFAQAPRLESVNDAPRSGRPARIPVEVRCHLVKLACSRPNSDGARAPFRDVWTYQALADALAAQTIWRLSVSEVGRTLRYEEIRPHKVRYWLKSEDPQFQEKAKRICDLYLNPPKEAVILCVDEKPMQCLSRKHPTRVDRRDGSLRYEYEYVRHGTHTLLGAFDVKTGEVFGRVVEHRDAATVVAFVDELVRRYEGKPIYIVWDNLNIHHDGPNKRWTHLNAAHDDRVHLTYTPKHASWLNQIEIWFSILQRRVLEYGHFASKEEQAQQVLGYIEHWNRWERHPFQWTWRAQSRQSRPRKRRFSRSSLHASTTRRTKSRLLRRRAVA